MTIGPPKNLPIRKTEFLPNARLLSVRDSGRERWKMKKIHTRLYISKGIKISQPTDPTAKPPTPSWVAPWVFLHTLLYGKAMGI